MSEFLSGKKLTEDFFAVDPVALAKALLNKIFVKIEGGNILAGKIVETEAYDESDEASHSYRGKTKRNETMFGKPGILYVYLTYGMYYCSNITAGREGEGSAALIRAVEPLEGIPELLKNRFGEKEKYSEKDKINIANGPGKFSMAFGLDMRHNGLSLLENDVFILENGNIPKNKIVAATRIGISKSTDLKWRFYIKDNPFVSKK